MNKRIEDFISLQIELVEARFNAAADKCYAARGMYTPKNKGGSKDQYFPPKTK